MKFACSPVDSSFFETAPLRFVHSGEIPAPARETFAVMADHERWPEWFSDLKKVVVTSETRNVVGMKRSVTLSTMVAYEHFFRWEDGRRVSFYFDACSVPLASHFAEDYLLEDLPGGRCKFTYSVAFTPRLLFSLGGPIGRAVLNNMFKRVPPALAQRMAALGGKAAA